jgi:hypothetical protein
MCPQPPTPTSFRRLCLFSGSSAGHTLYRAWFPASRHEKPMPTRISAFVRTGCLSDAIGFSLRCVVNCLPCGETFVRCPSRATGWYYTRFRRSVKGQFGEFRKFILLTRATSPSNSDHPFKEGRASLHLLSIGPSLGSTRLFLAAGGIIRRLRAMSRVFEKRVAARKINRERSLHPCWELSRSVRRLLSRAEIERLPASITPAQINLTKLV